RLGLEPSQPGPDLRLVQAAGAAVARCHARHRSGPSRVGPRPALGAPARRHGRAGEGRMASMSTPVTELDERLVLGPMRRYVDETSATVWVRTSSHARVTVERAGRTWSASTVVLHGSHYALVVCDGLLPG